MNRIALPLLLAACGDADGDTDAIEDPAEHACEAVADAGSALLGGPSPDDTAPELVLEVPATVTLDSAGPVYVRVVSDEDTAAILWVGTADVVGGISLDGATESLPVPSPNEACGDDIPEHYELDLEPGTWHLELGPSAAADVWLLLTEAGDHAH